MESNQNRTLQNSGSQVIQDPSRGEGISEQKTLSGAPNLNLPPEILSRIFIFACSLALIDKEGDILDKFRGARAVHSKMLVCKIWQVVIQETPQLWDTLFLRLPPTSLETANRQTTRWSKNAGDLPLHIHLEADLTQNSVWTNLISPAISRWATISLRSPSLAAPFRTVDLSIPPEMTRIIWTDLETAPQLTTLRIKSFDLQPRYFSNLPLPCLRHVTSFELMNARPPIVRMPSLRTLSLYWLNSSGEDIWNLLAGSSHLESIHLTRVKSVEIETRWLPDPGALALENLQHYSNIGCTWQGESDLSREVLLRSTGLESLGMDNHEHSIWGHPMPSHSLHRLTDLNITIEWTRASHLPWMRTFLKQTPFLETISIIFLIAGHAELFLQMLLLDPNLNVPSNILCPRLCHLHLDFSIVLPSLLLRMIHQREECLKQSLSLNRRSGHLDRFTVTLYLTLVDVSPKDGALKDQAAVTCRLYDAGLPEVQQALNGLLTGVGEGEFRIDSFSKVEDPEERFWKLVSILGISI